MLLNLNDQLRAAGARVQTRSRVDARVDAILEVELDGAKRRFAVEYKRRPLYPSQVPELERTRRKVERLGTPLLVAPYISEGLGRSLVSHGWSWADEHGNFDLRAPRLRLRQRLTRGAAPSTRGLLPRRGGGLAIVRALIARFEAEPMGATELARLTGVTQARASQVLAQLENSALVQRQGRRRRPDRAALLDAFLSEYPGPRGTEEVFYSLDSPREVALEVVRLAPKHVFISADVGPDLIRPWRNPTSLIVYARRPVNVARLDLVRADTRAEANVIVRNPLDRSVFGVSPTRAKVDGREVLLADPVQMIWDLHDLGGDDRAEAADHLRRWLLERR